MLDQIVIVGSKINERSLDENDCSRYDNYNNNGYQYQDDRYNDRDNRNDRHDRHYGRRPYNRYDDRHNNYNNNYNDRYHNNNRRYGGIMQ